MSKRSLQHVLFRTQNYARKTAIVTETNTTSYHQLQWGAHKVSEQLTSKDLNEERIAFLATPNENYVKNQWGIWAAGGIAVPLHCQHPRNELKYVLQDAQVSGIVCDPSTHDTLADLSKDLNIPILDSRSMDNTTTVSSEEMDDTDSELPQWNSMNIQSHRKAQILYTSGTTGRPKGVVTTHGNIHQQIDDIVTAWELTERDRLLHFLPLHHTHGILNNLLCPLYAGATVEMLPKAGPKQIWERYYSNSKEEEEEYTMMMAVPTIYMKMLEEAQELSLEEREKALEHMRKLRVAISGSAACPLRILEEWEKLTGQILLERYGMTELGMALTNPLKGERHPGYVGQPFPSVQVRLVDTETQQETSSRGELRVKGRGIFQEYWNRPEETAKEFDEEGWFKTGDIAEFNDNTKSYRMLGRASVDILKSGGYKISALEIEASILEHEGVAECSVVGIQDETWGEIIVAILRLRENCSMEDVQRHTKEHLASYKVPRKWIQLDEIPKNAMGKVNKKELRSSVEQML